jgi:hypothetical protein
MFSTLRSWLGRPARASRTPTRPRIRLALDHLEDRAVPAVAFDWGEVTNYGALVSQPDTTLVYDVANDLAVDAAGNRYVFGTAQSETQGVQFIAKYAPDNSVDWVYTFTGQNYRSGGAIAVGPSSGDIFVALRRSVMVNGNERGVIDIARLDASGTQAEHIYTAPLGDWITGDLAVDQSGNVYFTQDGHTVKLQPTGSGWQAHPYAVGGHAIDVSPDGSRIYVTGNFSGVAVDFDPTRSYGDNRDILSTVSKPRDTNYDGYLLRLSSNATTGALEFSWVGQIKGPHANDRVDDVVVSPDGVYMLGYYGGSTTGGTTDFDPGPGTYSLPYYFGGQYLTGNMYLLKLDVTNSFQWVKGLGGTASSSGYGDSYGGRGRLALGSDGSVYVADTLDGTNVDFDIEHSYPGDIDRHPGGNGVTFNNTLFVAKYSPHGAFRWAATGTTTWKDNVAPAGLAVTDAGIHVLAGLSDTTMTINPGGSQFTSDAYGDLFLGTFTQTADPVMLYVKQVSQAEGNSGTTAFTFEVYLSDPLDSPLTVNYSTADGTATAGSDYTATSGTIYFALGETKKTVTVFVKADTTSEPDETFALDLWAVDLGGPAVRGWATIANDDTTTGGGKKK